jgi:hypothetical protein
VLEKARLNRTRLHISLGDVATGRDWLEEFECFGFIGRSMGPTKVPLILPSAVEQSWITASSEFGIVQVVVFCTNIQITTTARLSFVRKIRLLFLRTGAHCSSMS